MCKQQRITFDQEWGNEADWLKSKVTRAADRVLTARRELHASEEIKDYFDTTSQLATLRPGVLQQSAACCVKVGFTMFLWLVVQQQTHNHHNRRFCCSYGRKLKIRLGY